MANKPIVYSVLGDVLYRDFLEVVALSIPGFNLRHIFATPDGALAELTQTLNPPDIVITDIIFNHLPPQHRIRTGHGLVDAINKSHLIVASSVLLIIMWT